jgi:hypothetical protein
MATQKLDASEFEIMTPRDFKHCTEAYLRLFVIVQMHLLIATASAEYEIWRIRHTQHPFF